MKKSLISRIGFYPIGLSLLLNFVISIYCNPVYAQITVSDNKTAMQLATALTGTGVTLISASLNCSSGANGIYTTGALDPIGIPNGIVLSTGVVKDTLGSLGLANPASSFASYDWSLVGGDANLNSLVSPISGISYHDACVLVITFKPAGDTIKFKYVFGSEEYPEYTCSNFNDVFGFFITGGLFVIPTNLALVPGTTIPVCINSINCGAGTFGTLSNCTAVGIGSPFCAYYIDNSASTNLVLDGLTTVLTAVARVSACDTYTLKMGIEDVFDGAYDSDVFIEGGSLTSNPLTSVTSTGTSGLPYCIRGCAPGNFVFHMPTPQDTAYIIHYTIGGTAINGTDYTTIPDSVIVPALADSLVLNINTLGVPPTGSKVITLTIQIPDPCHPGLFTAGPISSLTILDSFHSRILTPDTLICMGQHVNIIAIGDTSSAFTGILSYNWTPSGTLSSSTILNPVATPIATVTNTYSLTATAPAILGCAPEVNTITISVYDYPVLTRDSLIVKTCDSIPVQLHIYPNSPSYTYAWASSTYLSSTSIYNPIVDPTIPGDYTYTVTVFPTAAPICFSTDTIHVHNVPHYFDLGNPDTTICTGGSVQTRVSGDNEFSWLWAPPTGVSSTTVMNPIITPITTTTYTLTASYAACPDMVHSFNITLAIPAPATIISDTICLGMSDTVNVTEPGGIIYSYSWSPALYLTSTTTAYQVITPLTTGDFAWGVSIHPSSTTSCSIIDSIKLHVAPNDFILGNPDTIICYGQGVQTRITGGSPEFTWSWSPTLGVSAVNTMTPFITPTVSNNYVVTASYSPHCPDMVHSFNITVDTLAHPVTINDTICLGMALPIDLTFAGSNTYYFQWSPTNGYNDTIPNPILVPTVTGTFNYTILVRPIAQNCAVNDNVILNVLPNSFVIAPTDTAICLGKAVQVRATPYPEFSYQWIPTAGIGMSNIINPLIIPDTSATYVVSAYFYKCPLIYDTLIIDVQPMPTIFAGENRFMCSSDTLHITASVVPQWYTHYAYSWSPGTTLWDSTVQTVIFSDTISRELVLTISTPAGCNAKDSLYINVNPSKFLDTIQNFNFCPGDSVVLNASSRIQGVSYYWIPNIYLSDSIGNNPVLKPITSINYILVGTSGYGCRDTIHFHVGVNPSALIYLGDSVILYPGESYHINSETNCTSFNWTPAYQLSDPTASNPYASPDMNIKYVVTASTEYGCMATDSISIYVSDESLIDVPNAFTPGNGVDNKFKIIKKGIVNLNYFRIYNRWGNLMFETNIIDEGWDGSYKGKPQDFGVYVYEIQAVTRTGKIYNKQGNLTLIR